jgi:four helix bundle protein
VRTSFLFGCDIVRLYLRLARTPGAHRHVAGQLLHAGTSVGANAEEAHAAHSRADFAFRNGVVLREARESKYWLRMLEETGLADRALLAPLLQEASELVAIYTVTVKKARRAKLRCEDREGRLTHFTDVGSQFEF